MRFESLLESMAEVGEYLNRHPTINYYVLERLPVPRHNQEWNPGIPAEKRGAKVFFVRRFPKLYDYDEKPVDTPSDLLPAIRIIEKFAQILENFGWTDLELWPQRIVHLECGCGNGYPPQFVRRQHKSKFNLVSFFSPGVEIVTLHDFFPNQEYPDWWKKFYEGYVCS